MPVLDGFRNLTRQSARNLALRRPYSHEQGGQVWIRTGLNSG